MAVTRLRFVLHDAGKADSEALKGAGAAGVMISIRKRLARHCRPTRCGNRGCTQPQRESIGEIFCYGRAPAMNRLRRKPRRR